MLFFLLQSEDPSEPDRKSAALGSSETGGRSDHRLLTDITADARYGRRKAHTNTIPEDRGERRSDVLQSIDVKQVLTVWLRQPETNWGIEINAYDAKGNDLAVTAAEPGEDGLVSWAVNEYAFFVKYIRF